MTPAWSCNAAGAPGTNVTFAATDIGRGETVLFRGTVLTSRKTGVLAALGSIASPVVGRPRSRHYFDRKRTAGAGRSAAGRLRLRQQHDRSRRCGPRTGCDPVPFGIVPDDLDALRILFVGWSDPAMSSCSPVVRRRGRVICPTACSKSMARRGLSPWHCAQTG